MYIVYKIWHHQKKIEVFSFQSEQARLNPLQRFWRRGRERFIDSALIGVGIASAAVLVGTGIHFFASSTSGVSAEVLRPIYASILPPLTLYLTANGPCSGGY